MQAYGSVFFFFNDPATTEIYTLSLHDALPISPLKSRSISNFDKVKIATKRTGQNCYKAKHYYNILINTSTSCSC